jgi:hypothetical protein
MNLFWAQVVLAGATIFLSAISRPRFLLYLASLQSNIPTEFRSVTLSLPDFTLIALLVVTLARLFTDSVYRGRLACFAGQVVTWPDKWWLMLFLWMALGVFYALDGAMVRFASLHWGLVILLMLVLADLFRHEPRFRLPILSAFIISGILQSVIALLQAINRNPLGLWALGEIERFSYDANPFYRAPSLTIHPNYLVQGQVNHIEFRDAPLGVRDFRHSISAP